MPRKPSEPIGIEVEVLEAPEFYEVRQFLGRGAYDTTKCASLREAQSVVRDLPFRASGRGALIYAARHCASRGGELCYAIVV